jgi:hypothetical protein
MIGVVLTTSQTELRICTAYGTEWCWGQVDCHATDISTLRLDVFQIPKRVIAGLLELSSTHEEGSECIRMMHRAFLADHAMVTDVDVQMCHANSGLVEALHAPTVCSGLAIFQGRMMLHRVSCVDSGTKQGDIVLRICRQGGIGATPTLKAWANLCSSRAQERLVRN